MTVVVVGGPEDTQNRRSQRGPGRCRKNYARSDGKTRGSLEDARAGVPSRPDGCPFCVPWARVQHAARSVEGCLPRAPALTHP